VAHFNGRAQHASAPACHTQFNGTHKQHGSTNDLCVCLCVCLCVVCVVCVCVCVCVCVGFRAVLSGPAGGVVGFARTTSFPDPSGQHAANQVRSRTEWLPPTSLALFARSFPIFSCLGDWVRHGR